MASQATSRLAQMQMRFQQKQQQEREQRRIEMTGGVGATSESNVAKASIGNGKVRQMFDDRRRGIDRSHPLKPLTTTKTSVSTTELNASTNGRRKVPPAVAPKQRGATVHRSMTRSETYHFQANSNGNHHRHSPNEHNFDELDNLDQETFPNEFAAMSLGDKNNNVHNKYIADSSSMQSRTRSSNSMKLNPVQVKKSPHVTATHHNNNNSTSSRGSQNSSGNSSITQRQSVQSKATPQRSSAGRSSVEKTPSPQAVRTTKPPSARSSSSVTPKMAQNRVAAPRANAAATAKQTAPAGPPPAGMAQCRYCQRNFNLDRLEKHEAVCHKMMTSKRKVFDASKHRVAGTEAEKYVKKTSRGGAAANSNRMASNYSTAAVTTAAPKRSNWRKKHEEFINAIRAAKQVQAHLAKGGKLSDLPPPPPSDTSDYVQCPHCLRRFNETAAERHIPRCATMLHNKPKPGQGAKKR